MKGELLHHPSVQRIRRVAVALGELAGEVVFIGGAIAPLLQDDPPFEEARPTRDVDAVTASTSYAEVGVLHEALRRRGFSQRPGEAAHLHRWWSGDGDAFDLVPCGEHAGGSGQEWDRLALEGSLTVDLGGGVVVRIASAPAFLALKWAAFRDRGIRDPGGSHDLEDILALIASRPTIVREVAGAAGRVRGAVAGGAAAFLRYDTLADLLAGHLNNAQDPVVITAMVRGRLEAMRALSGQGPAPNTTEDAAGRERVMNELAAEAQKYGLGY